jgi:hypothetical protein
MRVRIDGRKPNEGECMGRALRWAYKLWKAKRDGGAREMIRVVGDRVIRKGELQDHCLSTPDWIVRDVLFVNGVETIPHPYRYRVLHQMEQLRAAGYTVGEKRLRSWSRRMC